MPIDDHVSEPQTSLGIARYIDAHRGLAWGHGMSFMNATDYAFTIIARPQLMRCKFGVRWSKFHLSEWSKFHLDCIWVHLALCAFVVLVGIKDVILVVIVAWWGVYADPTSVSQVP